MPRKNNSPKSARVASDLLESATPLKKTSRKTPPRKTKSNRPKQATTATAINSKLTTPRQEASVGSSAKNYHSQAAQSEASSRWGGIVAVLVLAVFIFVGVLIIQNCDQCIFWDQTEESNSAVANYQVPLGITIDSAPTDPTADWQKYRSENLSLAFKYPQEWKISENQGGISIATDWATTTILIILEQTEGDLVDYLEEKEAGRERLTDIAEKQLNLAGLPGLLKHQSLADIGLEQLNFYSLIKTGQVLSVALTTPQVDQAITDDYNLFLDTFELDLASPPVDDEATTTSEQSL
ncbi:MAG TPA: hypothetical protein PKL09_00345 [bacterium]|nr:hypothetical protein [bacterium]HNS33870.1 hypothetical protein [bacterium]HNZ73021.1 hypothetical protein [bacterium]HOH67117.1 hypothetical protein [bacterium]HQA64049.1 hypothetical protein [bacterium]